MLVRYVFDPAKDVINSAKHGISLQLAEVLFTGRYVLQVDDRFDYGEMREVAIGLIGNLCFVYVFVDRGVDRRVISLRRANKREAEQYDEAGE